MELEGLGEVPKTTKLGNLSKEELIERNMLLEFELTQVIRELYELRKLSMSDEQLDWLVAEQMSSLRDLIFGQKSERYTKKAKDNNGDNDPQGSAKAQSQKAFRALPQHSCS